MQNLAKHLKLLPLAAAIGMGSVPQAFAFTPGVECTSGEQTATCQLLLAESLSLETTVADMTDRYNQEYHLSGTVTIVSGKARLPMLGSDIVVKLGDKPELYGTAVIPFDKMDGLNNKVNFATIPRVTVGLVQQNNVEQVVGKPLPLNNGVSEGGSQRSSKLPYFVFHMDAGLAMSVNFSTLLGDAAKPLDNVNFSMPYSVSATAIFDPADPFIHFSYDETDGIDLSGLTKDKDPGITTYDITNDKGEVEIRFIQYDKGDLVEQNVVIGEMTYYSRNSDGNYVMLGGEKDNPTILAGSQFDPNKGHRVTLQQDERKKPDIGGFAVSAHGWIPYKAQNTEGLPEDVGAFSGQLVLSGTVPLGTSGVRIDGDVVTYIGEHGFAQGGNGDVSWGLPYLPAQISFDIKLGSASAALKLTDQQQMVFVNGEMKPEVEFLKDLLPIMPKQGTRLKGYIDSNSNETLIQIEGEMGMGAETFGKLIGLELNDLQMTTAKMTVTQDGFSIDGKTGVQIHPAIQLHGEVSVHAGMSWTHPEDLVLRLSGDMNVFGVALKDVMLEINSKGMFVNGAFVTPVSLIGMHGEITHAGIEMTGKGSIMLNLGDITGAMKDAHDTLVAAQAEVNRLQYEIDATRKTIQAERDRDAQRLADARQAVSSAQGVVNNLQGSINYEYGMISRRYSEIDSYYWWYRAASWYNRTYRYGVYIYEKGWRLADIARRYAVIAAYEASRAIANAALEAAKWTLAEMEAAAKTFPIDADARIIGLVTAKETADLALEVAKAPFATIPYVEGDFAGDIELTLGNHGIRGTVSANVSGYSLLQGSLRFDPQFEACLAVPNFGDACTRF